MAEKSHFERWCDIIAKTPKMNTRREPRLDYEYRYNELKKWTLDYLSEMDNPASTRGLFA